ncbi:hypothetical protein AAAC07_25630 [Pseudomonas aeruginosa]
MRSTLPPLTGLLMLGLGGCVSFHPAGPIGAPSETAQSTYPHAVQVEEVQITDRKITNADWRRTVSAALTQQIGQHVERGEYFGRLISFPAKVEGNDVVLKFSFSSLEGKRTPHPGYIPGALLTLTAWIWVNGPIYVDKYDLVGDLLIENAEGKGAGQQPQSTGRPAEHRPLGSRLCRLLPGQCATHSTGGVAAEGCHCAVALP